MKGDVPILEGIDVAGSLQRLGLEFDNLKRMLIRFADTLGPMLNALRNSVTVADYAAIARHGLPNALNSGGARIFPSSHVPLLEPTPVGS